MRAPSRLPARFVNAYLRGNREPGADALLRIASAAGLKLEVAERRPPVDPERASKILDQVLGLARRCPTARGRRLAYPPLKDRLAEAGFEMNAELVEKLLAIHEALKAGSLPHAFGGAIALAYCVQEPRGTRDLDVNIFVDAEKAAEVLAALPEGVRVEEGDVEKVSPGWPDPPLLGWRPRRRIPQQPPSPRGGRERGRLGRHAGDADPVLDCASLVIFKSFFARTKDWGDIEEVALATPEDVDAAVKAVAGLVGEDDPSYRRLAEISAANPP